MPSGPAPFFFSSEGRRGLPRLGRMQSNKTKQQQQKDTTPAARDRSVALLIKQYAQEPLASQCAVLLVSSNVTMTSSPRGGGRSVRTSPVSLIVIPPGATGLSVRSAPGLIERHHDVVAARRWPLSAHLPRLPHCHPPRSHWPLSAQCSWSPIKCLAKL